MSNVSEGAWQGSLSAKVRDFSRGLRLAYELIQSDGDDMSHNEMDVGLAFLLRFYHFHRIYDERLPVLAEEALNKALHVRKPNAAPHQITLAYVRLAHVCIILKLFNDAKRQIETILQLESEILREENTRYAQRQLASIFRHLGEMAEQFPGVEQYAAYGYYQKALGYARSSNAPDQERKTKKRIQNLERQGKKRQD